MTIRWRGAPQLAAQLKAARGTAPGLVGDALMSEGAAIMDDAQPVTPRDTGDLRASGSVDRTGPLQVTVGFGAPYAIFVHEAPESWNWTTPGTGPKFLERPAMAASAGLERRLAAAIGRKLL